MERNPRAGPNGPALLFEASSPDQHFCRDRGTSRTSHCPSFASLGSACQNTCKSTWGHRMHGRAVALVTGGSRGIGRGICQALAADGYAVAVNYAGNADAARETQRLLGPDVDSMTCQADVGNPADRARLVDEILARWDRIDVLVNN